MTVRAKFKVSRIERFRGSISQGSGVYKTGEVQNIVLFPVTGGNEENEAFYASTPTGKIELGTVNAAAAGEFALGAEVYVDFTPV